jgi:3-oxoacyl-[acyl-carrier protein] reductase
MDLVLKDQRMLVTGVIRGLGYAAAFALAKEGCKVTINGRDEVKIKSAAEKMSRETDAQVICLAGDVCLPEIPEKLVKGTAEAFGGLDILITNAGGSPPGSIDSLDEAAWQKGVDLCLMLHPLLSAF